MNNRRVARQRIALNQATRRAVAVLDNSGVAFVCLLAVDESGCLIAAYNPQIPDTDFQRCAVAFDQELLRIIEKHPDWGTRRDVRSPD